MNLADQADTLPITLRVFTVRTRRPKSSNKKPSELEPKQLRRRRLPVETLVFDLETAADEPAQRLNAGAWMLFRDRPGGDAPKVCVEEGLLYADDLPSRNPTGFAELVAYVTTREAGVAPGFPRRLALMS